LPSSERDGRKRRRQIVKGEGVRRRRGAAILSVSTPKLCEAGRVSLTGRQRTCSLARFKLALFTTKPAPKSKGHRSAAPIVWCRRCQISRSERQCARPVRQCSAGVLDP
jgi:hypothetical protein